MTIYYQDDMVTLYHGDCLDVLATMPDNSVDSVVTDPPYGLSNTTPEQVAETITRWVSGDREYLPAGRGFMGKEWDSFVPPVAVWDECLRVLKPGGHVVAFAGSRTHDFMTLSIRLAGFEIRDSLAWLYGSGFPKSMDVSKAIDKRREEDLQPAADVAKWLVGYMEALGISRRDICDHFEAENIAQQWTTHWTDGAVKPRVPRWEQWQELRRWLDLPDDMDAEVWRLNGRKGKPGDAWEKREVIGTRTVNGAEGSAGGYADGIASQRGLGGVVREIDLTAPATPEAAQWDGWGTALKPAFEPIVLARKPFPGTVAENVLEHGTGAINVDACRIGTEGGSSIPGGMNSFNARNASHGYRASAYQTDIPEAPAPSGRWPANVLLDEHAAAWVDEQSGVSKSRIGKPRGAASGDGWGMTATGAEYADKGGASRFFPVFKYQAKAPKSERPVIEREDGTKIQHPTVKPLAIMRWLIRLITPPGGTVLDPFAGSGTTIEAAMMEGFHPVGIEMETDYLPLITARITRAKTSVQEVINLGSVS